MSKPLLYGLLLSILMVAAPHASHLPLWVSALCAVLLSWRAYLNYSGGPLPKRWLLLTITCASLGGILIEFHTLFGREVGVTLLILFTTLKFMELRGARDATVLLYLACFIIIINFLYSQSIPIALYMLATLLVIVTTWVHLYGQRVPLRQRLHIAATLLLQAIPLTLMLFILFPRMQGPLWGLPQDAFASSGLSDSMAPGSMSRLILSDEVAFRVGYAGKPPRRNQMYWRGPVLWEFDGRTWTPGRTDTTVAPQFTEAGQPIDYSVTLEPHNKTWLFALDLPERISVPANITHDFRIVQKELVKARLRYDARSNLSYRANLHEAERQLQRALQLPPSLNPRARQLAAEWRAQAEAAPPLSFDKLRTGQASPAKPPSPQSPDGTTGETTSHSTKPASGQVAGYPASGRGGKRSPAGIDESVVRTALDYFNRENFQYTLEPPLLGINSVDEFLFEARQGFCEHYASSFVFLMRAAHIPARIVTGYLGGEYNAIGNYYIVRQSDAHAWAEVWLTNQGWVRIDPTAAIAPARVERGLSASVINNAALPFMARNPPQWLRDLRLNWDALANRWNQWVLGYNAELQFTLLSRLGMESVTWQKLALNMAAGMGLLVALFALLMLRHLIKRRPDRVQAAWLKLCRKLAKAGLPRAAHEGAQDYAARIAAARPDLADAMRDLAERYSALRYENRYDPASLQALQRAVAAFKL